MTRKPRSHVRILIYRTWAFVKYKAKHYIGLSLLLVLCIAPRSFPPGTPVFPPPQNLAFPNFKFDQEW